MATTLLIPSLRRLQPFLAFTHLMLVHSLAGSNMALQVCVCSKYSYSTKTPYESRQSIPQSGQSRSGQPIFTYWLARHGTRWPTKKRMKQMQKLQTLFEHAGHGAKRLHPWITNWTSPFEANKHLAGLLHPKGVDEMHDMGVAFRQHWPQGSTQDILSAVDVHATAKARTQDSARAFMEGLCGGTHTYTDQTGAAGITGHDRHVIISGDGQHGSYTIKAKPIDQDPVLRFFDMCPAYDDYVTQIDADFLDSWAQQQWESHIPALTHRLQLRQGSLTGQQVDALWQLCQQEAGLWGVTHKACSLFPSQEAQHMEWVDDVQMFMRKGGGSPRAYHMAAPLLADIATSLQAAASRPPKSGFKAKLCFAHAETIIPLACLLGLFGPTTPAAEVSTTSSGEQCSQTDVQRNTVSGHTQSGLASEPVMQHHDEYSVSSSTDSGTDSSDTGTCSSSNASMSMSSSNSMTSRQCDSGDEPFLEESVHQGGDDGGQAWVPPLPPPPLTRHWHGSMIAPYGANIQFALHRRTDSQAITDQMLYVEVLYNGIPVTLPGCQDSERACTLEAFLEAAQALGMDDAAFQAACSPAHR